MIANVSNVAFLIFGYSIIQGKTKNNLAKPFKLNRLLGYTTAINCAHASGQHKWAPDLTSSAPIQRKSGVYVKDLKLCQGKMS